MAITMNTQRTRTQQVATDGTGRKVRMLSWGITTFVALFLLFDGVARVAGYDPYVEGLAKAGYPTSLAFELGAVLVVCTVCYVIPRTAVLGAVLLTGYLGGAVATHVRLEESNFVFAIAMGVLVWGALYLRDERVRALNPFRAT